MIDIKQHIFALQFKDVFKLFDNNYSSVWKTLFTYYDQILN